MENEMKAKAARFSIISNSMLIILKLSVGVLMQSVSVISESIHSSIDLIASIIAYFSVKEASKPADEDHRYGHGKIENVSGTVEAILIFVAAIIIIVEAAKKLQTNQMDIESLSVGAIVMAISALANFFISKYLLRVGKKTDSIALQADGMHLRTDVYTSAGVFAGLIAIKVTGIKILDPIFAFGVALLIIKAAFDLTKSAFVNILDVKLPEEDELVIREVLSQYSSDYIEYHKLRTRKAGSERHIDLHLVVPKARTVEISHSLSHEIADKIEEILPNSHVLIHLEPCENHCGECKSNCMDKYL